MLSKEILNEITLDELKSIRDEWHRINDICTTTPDGYKQFEITNEDPWYIDRDIDTARHNMRITTFKEEKKVEFSKYIILYNEDCEIAETDIDELESFINDIEKDIEYVMESKLWKAYVEGNAEHSFGDIDEAEYCAMIALDMESCLYTRTLGNICISYEQQELNKEAK